MAQPDTAASADRRIGNMATRNPHSSTTQFPNVFWSETVRAGNRSRRTLASLMLEDCIRMHGRLETPSWEPKQPQWPSRSTGFMEPVEESISISVRVSVVTRASRFVLA
jgi:hypothetical protein